MSVTGTEQYQQVLRERFGELTIRVGSVVEAFGNKNVEGKILRQRVEAARNAATNYMDLLPSNQRPAWLGWLASNTGAIDIDANLQTKFLRKLVAEHHQIRLVEFAEDQAPTLDFDKVFQECLAEGTLDEHFGKLIDAVRKIIESEELNDIAVQQALQSLLRTLDANRGGSYLAIQSTVTASLYARKLTREIIDVVPGLNILARAWDASNAEIEKQFRDAREAMLHRAVEEIARETPRIKSLPSYENATKEIGIELLQLEDASSDDG